MKKYRRKLQNLMRMKERARDRKNKRKHRNITWKSRVDDKDEKVLMRTRPSSDAIAGVTGKFITSYEGPYLIGKVICPSTVELLTEMESL